jgi:hypothetical protein
MIGGFGAPAHRYLWMCSAASASNGATGLDVAGYRELDFDFEDDGFVYDVVEHSLLLEAAVMWL